MSKLVTKFKYMKPNRDSIGNYAKYIATREGVEKIDESYKLMPSSKRQQIVIDEILKDFPDSKDMLEYEDYIKNQTVGTASEFITRALEDNAFESMNTKTYADYIATRPRAQRFGSHGLFTDDGVQVKLNKVSQELNLHQGNVWTVIISLRREDAERLGFNKGERWRDMLRTQTESLSTNLKIPMEHLKWFAAFHNESYHPHVHLIAYSTVPSEGYLSKKGIFNLRSSFARDIFAQDLLCVYEKQTEHRDDLKAESREKIKEIVSKINTGTYDNPKLEELLVSLANRLSKTSGKKVYGYLKADVKAIVDSIVDELSTDERISALYDLWYEQREEVIKTYTQEMPERIPLSQNKEFKSIRNAVIQEAMNIVQNNQYVDDEPEIFIPKKNYKSKPVNISLKSGLGYIKKRLNSSNKYYQYSYAKMLLKKESGKYNPYKALKWLEASASQGYSPAKYKLGKLFLKGDEVPKDVNNALKWLKEAADDKNQNAEYMLGKLYLYGRDVKKDYDKAITYLSSAAEHGNQYAEQLLNSIKSNRNWYATIGAIRLLHHICRIIQNRLEDENSLKSGKIDRKLKRKIDEKKQAHGLRQG